MSYSRRSRYSRSPSYERDGRSVSRSLSRSRSRSRSVYRDVENPGNNLYVTGLSPRITKKELERYFSSEGKVVDVHLVVDPWTRESRGFGFVTMSAVEEADRCIKYLNRSVFEGRVITVEKAKRRRGRTPTPGRYLGLRTVRVHRLSRSDSSRRSPSYSPYRRSLSGSSGYSYGRSRSRSYSPYNRRSKYYSRSRSPYSGSPIRRRDRSYSPYDSRHHSPVDRYYRRYHSPDDRYYRRCHSPDERYYRRYHYRSLSRSPTPRRYRRTSRRSYSRSVSYSPRRSRSARRSYSRSISPRPRRSSRRSYSGSMSPRPRGSSRRSYSRSISPKPRSSRRSYSRSVSPKPRKSSRRSASPRSYSPSS